MIEIILATPGSGMTFTSAGIEKLKVNFTLRPQELFPERLCTPTGLHRNPVSLEQLRVMFPALYFFEIWQETSIPEISRQVRERHALLFGGLPSNSDLAF